MLSDTDGIQGYFLAGISAGAALAFVRCSELLAALGYVLRFGVSSSMGTRFLHRQAAYVFRDYVLCLHIIGRGRFTYQDCRYSVDCPRGDEPVRSTLDPLRKRTITSVVDSILFCVNMSVSLSSQNLQAFARCE